MSVSDKLDRIHNDFRNHAQDYFYPDDIPDDAIFSDEVISEKIDDLKKTVSKPLKRQVKAIEKIADSAKTQADIAVHTSKKAGIKGWIAVIVSVIGLTIEIIVNFSEISTFISHLL